MLSSHRPPQVAATIDGHGLVTIWGLPGPQPRVADHDEPTDAYHELLNLVFDHSVAIGGQVWLAVSAPNGQWHMAITPDLQTVPLEPDLFDPPPTPGAAEVLAAAEGLTVAALLAGADAALAATMPDQPAAVLALATDPDPAVRAAAVAHLATWGDDPAPVVEAPLPPDRLGVLADCRLAWVRAGVAGNPGTDPDTLTRLAADPDPMVRQAVAARMDLTPEIALALCEDPAPAVRAELGRNPTAAFLRERTPVRVVVAVDPVPLPGPVPDLPTEQATPHAPAAPTRPPLPAGAASPSGRGHRGIAVAGMAVAAVLLAGAGYAAVTAAGDPPPGAAAASGPVVAWNGTWLPAGPDGPSDPDGPVATGFAHTEAGAAAAAAHLSVRIDPYAGPASFTPTITSQTFGGNPATLLAATRARYQQAADAAGISRDAPIPTSTGRIIGWRTQGWTPDGPVSVHLRVTGPDGADLDFRIDVVWTGRDYALVDPTRADTFTAAPADDPSDYRSF